MISIRHKSMACLTRNFLELSVNPSYNHSLLHVTLFNIHILGDNQFNLVPPPYYNATFFENIRAAKDSGWNIAIMTCRQWYHFLLKRDFCDPSSPSTFKPSKVEIKFSENDWRLIWSQVRHPSYNSQMSSIAFKIIHNLIRCEVRMSNISTNNSPLCRFSCSSSPVSHIKTHFLQM